MPQIVGLSLLLLWSLGFLTPYSLIGFIELLLIIAFVKFLLKKIKSLELSKFRIRKKSPEQSLVNFSKSYVIFDKWNCCKWSTSFFIPSLYLEKKFLHLISYKKRDIILKDLLMFRASHYGKQVIQNFKLISRLFALL